jgi:hypothetical protein
VDEAAEQVATDHMKILCRQVDSDRRPASARVGRLQVECAVGPPEVVVPGVDAEDVFELATADDQEAVEALVADAANPALHVGVRVGSPDRHADESDVLARQKSVEGARELRVAVVDQEPHLLFAVVELHQQVARLLQHPGVFGLLVQARYSIRRLPTSGRRARIDVAARPCRR